MAETSSPARRERVEKGIYRRRGADGRETYEIGFRDAQGRQRWRRVTGGITVARNQLAEEIAKRSRGEQVAADPRLTFNGAADEWFEHRVSRLRQKTRETYKSNLVHLRAEFGRERLTRISPRDVAGYVAKRQTAGAKGWTIRGEVSVLSGIFRYASRHLGFPGQSPTASLDRIERPSLDDQREKRILTMAELERLLTTIPERTRLLYELASETGGRRGEVLGLNWSEVDLEAGTVEFTHQLSSRTRQRVPLKTKRSRRVVEITPAMALKLKAAKLKARRSGDHDLVFPGQDGNGRDGGSIARTLDRAAKRAGLEPVMNGDQMVLPAPTFHSLRHTHASALIAAGWDLEEVSARLGHADVSVTARAYVRAYDHATRSADRRSRLQALYVAPEGPTSAEVRSITG